MLLTGMVLPLSVIFALRFWNRPTGFLRVRVRVRVRSGLGLAVSVVGLMASLASILVFIWARKDLISSVLGPVRWESFNAFWNSWVASYRLVRVLWSMVPSLFVAGLPRRGLSNGGIGYGLA